MKKDKALRRLRKVHDEIDGLKQLSSDSPQFKTWRRNAGVAIRETFGSDSDHIRDFRGIGFAVSGRSDSEIRKAYIRDLESDAAVLQSMIDEVNEYWEDEGEVSGSSDSCSGLRTSGVVLENIASLGSDYLRTKLPSGSHYLRMSADYLRRAHLVENDAGSPPDAA